MAEYYGEEDVLKLKELEQSGLKEAEGTKRGGGCWALIFLVFIAVVLLGGLAAYVATPDDPGDSSSAYGRSVRTSPYGSVTVAVATPASPAADSLAAPAAAPDATLTLQALVDSLLTLPTWTPPATATTAPTWTPLPTYTPYPSPPPTETAAPTNTAPAVPTATLAPTETATRPALAAPALPTAVVLPSADPLASVVANLQATRASLRLATLVAGSLLLLSLLAIGVGLWRAHYIRLDHLSTLLRDLAPLTGGDRSIPIIVGPTEDITPLAPALPQRVPVRLRRLAPGERRFRRVVTPVTPVTPVAHQETASAPPASPLGEGEIEFHLPFDPAVPPDARQRAYIRARYVELGSLNKVAQDIWQQKSRIVLGYIREALEEGGIPYPSRPPARPIVYSSH